MADRSLKRARRRLRLWLVGFFIALALPSALLVQRALVQLQWEAFHGEQTKARALVAQIDLRLRERLEVLDTRPFEDFRFAIRESDGTLRRSPLSDLELAQSLPGVMGYFQVDARGRFSTPLLPADDMLERGNATGGADWERRTASARRIRELLIGNRLVSTERSSADESLSRDIPAPAKAAREDRRVLAQTATEPEPAEESQALPRAEVAMVERAESVESDLPMRPRRRAPSIEPSAASVAEPVRSQAGFDKLSSMPSQAASKSAPGSLGRLSELNLNAERALQRHLPLEDERPEGLDRGSSSAASSLAQRPTAKPDPNATADQTAPAELTDATRFADALKSAPKLERQTDSDAAARVRLFEDAGDAYELRMVDSGHFVLFRKIWHQGERYIQGALIERAAFIDEAILAPYRRSALARSTSLVVAFDGDVLALESVADGDRYVSRPSELRGELLNRARLSAPLNGLELVLSVTELPPAPGAPIVIWTALVLALVMAGGLLLMEHLGRRQLALVAQQQDFVAAVSHELKTPLTSIRMYSEMLCAGWGDDERRMAYYRYIHDESERLSRLIANVLQLARMNHDELKVAPQPMAVTELLELFESRSASALARAGFKLIIDADRPGLGGRRVLVDADAMLQILLNLLDNALKFAADIEPREVRLSCREDGPDRLCLALRDFGPGVAEAELKPIFRPFYRGAAATGGATKGTGIGLALVARLAAAQGAEVTARNRDPGLEIRILLPLI